jgi:outer membrane protein TolC
VQLALKSLQLTADSLNLALAQSHDIELRFRAGAASRLDQISAHKDTLSYQMKFNQVQADLARELRDLFALTGDGEKQDTARPVPGDLAKKLPPGVAAPTLVIDLELPEKTLSRFSQKEKDQEKEKPSSRHPELVSLEKSEEASRFAIESVRGGYWPRIQLQAKAQIIYPNVVLPEQANQNTLGINLSFPIFEGALTQNQLSQRSREALAVSFQKAQRQLEFDRDWQKIQNALANLRRQQHLNQQSAQETQQIGKLTYNSYRNGRGRFLDVQAANFRLLEVQVNAAEIDQQILEQTANLDYLSSQGEEFQR